MDEGCCREVLSAHTSAAVSPPITLAIDAAASSSCLRDSASIRRAKAARMRSIWALGLIHPGHEIPAHCGLCRGGRWDGSARTNLGDIRIVGSILSRSPYVTVPEIWSCICLGHDSCRNESGRG